MILTLDVGNSHIYGGVFDGDKLQLQFRKSSKIRGSSDELGLFLRAVLRENEIPHSQIQHVAVCSVVPDFDHTLKNCSVKYFGVQPFILQAGVKTGLRIRYRNPLEVGADRIANSVAATHLYPKQNLVILDFGTATTFCAVSFEKDYLGGSILAGVGTSASALESNTAKLPSVEILAPECALGRTTVESIQSGLYFGTIGAVHEIVGRISNEAFEGKKPFVIGTGGFASLFAKSQIFDIEIPDLVLRGLLLSYQSNL